MRPIWSYVLFCQPFMLSKTLWKFRGNSGSVFHGSVSGHRSAGAGPSLWMQFCEKVEHPGAPRPGGDGYLAGFEIDWTKPSMKVLKLALFLHCSLILSHE